MNLLLATDHTYICHPSGIYDNFCFDRQFFDDYRVVFKNVQVIARVEKRDDLPGGFRRSDGDGVDFLPVRNVHGSKWLFGAGFYSKTNLDKGLDLSDVVIARVPSVLGRHAAQRAIALKKPFMVEITGDPKTTIENSGRNISLHLAAWIEALYLKKLAQNAAAASYVSRNLLPEKYPVRPGIPSECISSIRLDCIGSRSHRMYDPARPFQIVLVASFFAYKRHIDILKACRILMRQGLNLKVQLIGDGPLRVELAEQAKQWIPGERVIFHGHISDRHRLDELIDSSDLFVMSSASEGLPRAMIEAMARGLPVIGTDIPGICELTRPEDRYPVGNYQALANLLKSLIQNPDRLVEMSQYSLSIAKQYTREILSPRRISLYRLLCEQALKSNRSLF